MSFSKRLMAMALAVALFSLSLNYADALIPYSRSLFDAMMPTEIDPFRILEQTPLTIPKGIDPPLALARTDWKETGTSHVILLDVPGLKRDDIKIEVEENRVLKVSGERKAENEMEGEKWHRAERTTGKFWRQFRLPGNADLDQIKASLEDGVLKINVPKFVEQKKKQAKVIDIVEQGANANGEDIKATKAAAK
ncbi:hypothetical protein ACFE04_024233 [Oxalis oulophora]